MSYFVVFFILCAGYYTLTYGISLWRADKDKLAGFGAVMAAAIGTIAPMIYILFKK